jgi:magnesium chelatase family protein
MHTKIYSATTLGVDAYPVEVEVDLSFGLLQFFIVGLPDAAIKESKQRIVTALKNCGIKLPERKITVNLAPADLKKEGTLFDLPIAIGIVHAAQLVSLELDFLQETLFIGELSLDGGIRSVKGVLPIAYGALKMGKKRIIVPEANTHEAALCKDLEVIGVANLTQLMGYLRKEVLITPAVSALGSALNKIRAYEHDFSQVKGQEQAKRALQIAAAGRHNILFIGSPGSGKTMLAKRLPTIMPPLSFDEMIETSKIYSISGKLNGCTLITDRPFRNPHHTTSQAGLVGGGSFPQPGEISLAHNGILFLDELTEFKRGTLEVLRQPIETKSVSLSRALYSLTFPAAFLMIAALNPCPCGFLGDKRKQCSCSSEQIKRYIEKLSGPLLDRIDLQITVPAIEYDTVVDNKQIPESSACLYSKVERAVKAQQERCTKSMVWNADMTPDMIDKYCVLTPPAQELVKKAFEKLNLSMRGYHKLLKVARTIADLEGSAVLELTHVREALLYRSLDQSFEKNR